MLEYSITPAYRSIVANLTYVCPRCGYQWARLTLIPHAGWAVTPRTCEKCPPTFFRELPGSLADSGEAAHNDGHGTAHLPREALLRELQLYAGVDMLTAGGYNPPIKLMEDPRMTNDLESRIAELRSKVLTGTVTDQELREAIRILRAERMNASVRRTEAKAAKAPVDGQSILEKLMRAA